jgi:hypothetical protein
MMNVPIDGVEAQFTMKTDILDKNGYRVPVFEAKIAKDVVLYDQDQYLLAQEKALVSVDGVNGPEIIIGSLTDVSTSGNWPTIYDANNE